MADYIWLSKEGAATVYINVIGGNPADWAPLNGGQPIASGVGGYRRDIRFADIKQVHPNAMILSIPASLVKLNSFLAIVPALSLF